MPPMHARPRPARQIPNTGDPVMDNGYSVGSGVLPLLDSRISMEMSPEGFYVPIVEGDSRLLSDPALQAVSSMSPGALDESEIGRRLFGSDPGILHHPVIGYFRSLHAGHVVEGDYRANGSSGGFATWLLVQLLEEGVVEGVIHVKAAAPESGALFDYSISRTAEEIRDGAKSRYYPVEFSGALRQAQLEGGRYALVGIPSFIHEARLLASHHPEFADTIKVTVGLICGHQKSARYAESIGWESGIRPGDLVAIDFRKKDHARPANDYLTEMTGWVDGRLATITRSQREIMVSDWGHGFFKARFSDFTDDALNETADVAIGDAWLPQYTADWRGSNIVIVRDSQIAAIVERGRASGALALDDIDVKTVLDSQVGLIHHTRDELPYRLHLFDAAGRWRPEKRLAASGDLPFLRKCIQVLRKTISEQSHIKYQEALRRNDWTYFRKSMVGHLRLYRAVYMIIRLRRAGPRGLARKVAKVLGLREG